MAIAGLALAKVPITLLQVSLAGKRSIRIDNIAAIINDLSEQRLKLSSELKQAEKNDGDKTVVALIRKSIAGIDDGISKWNKTLASVTKEDSISIAIHIKVMEQLFNSLRKYNEGLYLKTLEFQEYYVNQLVENG